MTEQQYDCETCRDGKYACICDDTEFPNEFFDQLPEVEFDIDVCTHCGKYYAMSPHLKELWHKHWKPMANEVMPQRCEKCMVSDGEF